MRIAAVGARDQHPASSSSKRTIQPKEQRGRWPGAQRASLGVYSPAYCICGAAMALYGCVCVGRCLFSGALAHELEAATTDDERVGGTSR